MSVFDPNEPYLEVGELCGLRVERHDRPGGDWVEAVVLDAAGEIVFAPLGTWENGKYLCGAYVAGAEREATKLLIDRGASVPEPRARPSSLSERSG